jgi:hypothetical protein
MVDDALALGIHHAGINVSYGSLFQMAAGPGFRNDLLVSLGV